MDDSQLIDACKKRDRNAQRVLYERYAPVMMGVCLRYSKEEQAARDLLHDGFIRIFSQIDSFSGKGSFEGWLKRIFVNMALENYRNDKKKYRFMEEYGYLAAGDFDFEADDPVNIEEVSMEKVLEMIQSLPQGYRTVFNLFVFENISHRKIGEMLGINEAASRSQFCRAKAILRKKISAFLNHKERKCNEQ